ncbi:choice-of-anchor Q domain-containing protein [Parasediminibacterium sp. JCM 36343]|uniref:choice-of-anchor Q domain-containing protein n=1 Tax=Parasediminibacterium sp. JCM 36343 TaxID=3374279 RepID=UPI00397B9CB0
MKKIAIVLSLHLLALAYSPLWATNYYVKPAPAGSNSNKGTSPTTPFATIQRAHDVSLAGDTIFFMAGTHTAYNTGGDIVTISRSGTASKYIVYTKYPGDNPIIHPTNWNAFKITYGASYIVIDGLTVQGNNSNLTLAGALAQPGGCPAVGATPNGGIADGTYNTNGIYVDGSQTGGICHHVIVKNCEVYECAGGGISSKQSDYITFEGNKVHDNAIYSQFGSSGISNLNTLNWDNDTINYKIIVRNNIVYNNEMLEPWVGYSCQITDGNGIIFDSNNNTSISMPAYTGKSLCENNICYNNGGRGIHVFQGSNVTVINNTCYQNCKSSAIVDGDLNASFSSNVKFYNNIAYARTGKPSSTLAKSTNFTADYNLFYNGSKNAFGGTHNMASNPLFTNASMGDFTLLPNSPAINVGSSVAGQFADTDLLGIKRPISPLPDMGAYEYNKIYTANKQFTPDYLVALKANVTTGITGTVSLVEYVTVGPATGYAVAIPATTKGKRLVMGGNGSFEGQLSRSADGRYLCFAGYDTATAIANTTTAAWLATKVVGRVSFDGLADLSTRIPPSIAYKGSAMRNVVSNDGSSFWVTSNAISPSLQQVNFKDTNAAIQINTNSYRSVGIFNNSLYACANNIGTFTGLPFAAAATKSLGANPASGNGASFVLLDTDSSISYNNTGYDVLYISDANTSNKGTGIYKYYWNTAVTPNVWTFANAYDVTKTGNAIPAIIGKVNALNQPVLYAVTGNAANNAIISILDAAGRTANMDSANVTVNTVANAGSGAIFKGVAFAPLANALPLPVKLVSFTGSVVDGKGQLNWSTSAEINTKSFVVEKGFDGISFFAIGSVAANNTVSGSNYSYKDALTYGVANYYRLKIMDNNGQYTYSSVVNLKGGDGQNEISVSPNPMVGNTLTVRHPKSVLGATITVATIEGKICKQVPVFNVATQTSFMIDGLLKGSYVLSYNGLGKKVSVAFIKR